jgi:hypothetical protein
MERNDRTLEENITVLICILKKEGLFVCDETRTSAGLLCKR